MQPDQLRQLLARHHRESYGWALRCCADRPEEAEDVLQEVYLKIWEGKARFQGRSAFKTWLFSVIRNTASDYLRKRRTTVISPITEKEQAIGTNDGTEEAMDRGRETIRLKKALSRLSVRQQEVLLLVFYHDLTIEEAAEILEITVGSARTHYERGKQHLRTQMKRIGK